jgi:hypothetical protein
MRRYLLLIGAVAVSRATPLGAQAPAEPPPLPLLERMIGQWTMTGTVRGRPATYRLGATWVLQRRFLELHMVDVQHTPPRYEARVFIGPDTASGRILGHWLDNFGAAYSVPPASGVASGDSLTLDFPYPSGVFHDTFAYDATTDTWTIRLDAADGAGGWKRFADYRTTRR